MTTREPNSTSFSDSFDFELDAGEVLELLCLGDCVLLLDGLLISVFPFFDFSSFVTSDFRLAGLPTFGGSWCSFSDSDSTGSP